MTGFVRIGGLMMALAVAFIGLSLSNATPNVATAAGTTVGIDFNTTDNTFATVGTITTCKEVASGASYTFDVYVQNVPGDTNTATPDGMIGGQYTFNSISGNTDTARTAKMGFIDLGAGLSTPGNGGAEEVDNVSSTPVGNSTGSDTILSSNDASIGGSGASGTGFWVRMTYTAPTVSAPTIVPLTLTGVTLNDPLANELPVTTQPGTLAVGGASCAAGTPTQAPTPSPIPTATPIGQPTPTPSPTPTATPIGQTPSPTPTPSPIPTPSPTPTPTPIPTATPIGQTPSPTPTSTPSPTPTRTPTPTTGAVTPTPTRTPTPAPTPRALPRTGGIGGSSNGVDPLIVLGLIMMCVAVASYGLTRWHPRRRP